MEDAGLFCLQKLKAPDFWVSYYFYFPFFLFFFCAEVRFLLTRVRLTTSLAHDGIILYISSTLSFYT